MSDGVTLKGPERELASLQRELASLQRVLDANGPRVAFVYGVAGIGKSALLNAFASGVRASGTQVWRIDCAAIDPTESSFRAALDAAGWRPGSAGVVLVDTYEMFRIADPLVGLTDEAAQAFLADANVAEDHADMICRIARGHSSMSATAASISVALASSCRRSNSDC